MSTAPNPADDPLALLHDSLAGIASAPPEWKKPLGKQTFLDEDTLKFDPSSLVAHTSWMKPDFINAWDSVDDSVSEHRGLAMKLVALAAFAATLAAEGHFDTYCSAIKRADHIDTTTSFGRIRNALAARSILETLATAEPMLRTLPVHPGGPTVFALLGLDPDGPPVAQQLGVEL